jgi:hypothetical protein
MKDSSEAKAQKANAEVGYGPNNPEPIQIKVSSEKKDSNHDALEAVSEYINKSDCE